MAENTSETTPSNDVDNDSAEVEQNFVTKFAVKHPRITRVAAIAGGTTVVVLGAVTANTVRKNRAHLHAAADAAKETLMELSDAVSPTDTDV